jgi:hypothetical protein
MKTFFWFLLGVCALALTGCAGASRIASTAESTPSQPASTPVPSQPSTPPSSPSSAPAGATTLSAIQASAGWNSWGQLAPVYQDCSAPCPGVTWSMKQAISSPSLSGNATEFQIGGTTPYSDVLFSIPLVGQLSTQGVPDNSHALLPTIHNLIYDADFYVTDAEATQVLEFDISMYMSGVSMIWGNQCNNLGDKDWDIWDNANNQWVSTGASCNLIDHAWNHVTIEAQRQSDNTLLFESITLNGNTANINKSYAPGSAPATWWGITVNYQMDGDYTQSGNTTYLDNFTLTYW